MLRATPGAPIYTTNQKSKTNAFYYNFKICNQISTKSGKIAINA